LKLGGLNMQFGQTTRTIFANSLGKLFLERRPKEKEKVLTVEELKQVSSRVESNGVESAVQLLPTEKEKTLCNPTSP
ncbi:hypothetical protein Tco_0373080, partial [Tanacetum coccineum]